jgi:hypothetical protein
MSPPASGPLSVPPSETLREQKEVGMVIEASAVVPALEKAASGISGLDEVLRADSGRGGR